MLNCPLEFENFGVGIVQLHWFLKKSITEKRKAETAYQLKCSKDIKLLK